MHSVTKQSVDQPYHKTNLSAVERGKVANNPSALKYNKKSTEEEHWSAPSTSRLDPRVLLGY